MNYADASQAVPVFDPIGLWKSGSNGQSDKDAFDVLLATEERELQAALDDAFRGGPGDRPETRCLILLVFICSSASEKVILSSDCIECTASHSCTHVSTSSRHQQQNVASKMGPQIRKQGSSAVLVESETLV